MRMIRRMKSSSPSPSTTTATSTSSSSYSSSSTIPISTYPSSSSSSSQSLPFTNDQNHNSINSSSSGMSRHHSSPSESLTTPRKQPPPLSLRETPRTQRTFRGKDATHPDRNHENDAIMIMEEKDMVDVSWDAIASSTVPPSSSSRSCLSIRLGPNHQSHSQSRDDPTRMTMMGPRRRSSQPTTTRTAPTSVNTHRIPPFSSHKSVLPPEEKDEEEDHASGSDYVAWPGTQDAHGNTIPIRKSEYDTDEDQDTVREKNPDETKNRIPKKTPSLLFSRSSMSSSCKKKETNHSFTNDPNRTINTSATTIDSSFQSVSGLDGYDNDEIDQDRPEHISSTVDGIPVEEETDFFVGAQQAAEQTQLQYDPTLFVLQQPIPLKRSVDSISIPSHGRNRANHNPNHDPNYRPSSLLSSHHHNHHVVTTTDENNDPSTHRYHPNTTTTSSRNDSHSNTPDEPFMKGYRGFIEKTKEIPSLFDTTADSASETTTATASTPSPTKSRRTAITTTEDDDNNHYKNHPYHTNRNSSNKHNDNHRSKSNYSSYDTETYVSDVFDGISLFSSNDYDATASNTTISSIQSLSLQQYHQRDKLAHVPRVTYPPSIVEEKDDDDNITNNDDENSNINKYVRNNYYHPPKHSTPSNSGSNSNTAFQLVTLPGIGITTIQTTDTDYRNRYTAPTAVSSNASYSDIGSGFTNSTTMTPIPDVQKMLQSGRHQDSALHGISGNIGQSSSASRKLHHPVTVNTTTHEQYSDTKKQWKGSQHMYSNNNNDDEDHNSSYSSSGSQYSMDDPSGLYVDGDYLSEYYIKPSIMKKVLLKYRTLSDQCIAKAATTTSKEQYDVLVDERKAFALLEMRSRIMEKDIERQLERRGGSFTVDDIVTTSYHRTAHRIRDAVIVSKAWRDGATISDVIHTAQLTQPRKYSYAISRPPPPLRHWSVTTRHGGNTNPTWEMVRWLDDTDFMQYRCPSLGSRHMHGFEMFTIGDCQSILLKLTHERCNELRQELNVATEMQINAEELMKEEESESNNENGMLSEAEMSYLSALEQVKTISKKLVAAEKSFALVRDRIRTLISRYETMLLKIEAGSYTGASSIISYESSYYSEYDHKQYMKEERVWAKRAMRAEIRAEIAAREALLAKQHAAKIQSEKMREIDELRKKLDELQSENSVASGSERERMAFTRVMSQQQPHNNHHQSLPNKTGDISRDKVDGVKQRFRDRMAERKRQTMAANDGMSASLVSAVQGRAPRHPSSSYQNNGTKRHHLPPPSAQHQAKRELLWSAGEEMFQQMVFYERSLEAVVADDTK